MSACKGCGATVLWAVNETTGKAGPLDPDPVDDGNVVITRSPGEVLYRVVPPGEGTHVSHYATCPDGAGFRKTDKRGKRT